jgi:hypothetical protein
VPIEIHAIGVLSPMAQMVDLHSDQTAGLQITYRLRRGLLERSSWLNDGAMHRIVGPQPPR